jgi:hypothetical protein
VVGNPSLSPAAGHFSQSLMPWLVVATILPMQDQQTEGDEIED